MVNTKTDNGLVVGNTYDKYGTRNPVSRRLIAGFFRSLDRLVVRTGASSVTEVGCGEGHLARHLARQGKRVTASDVSRLIVDEAQRLTAADGLTIDFHVADIYKLDPRVHRNELVICCEVLEHLEAPEEALRQLIEIADPFLLLSVPREPIWRVLNVCRLKYLRDLGNTPGHLQHWSQAGFLDLVSRFGEPVQVDSPFPWTMVLLRRR